MIGRIRIPPKAINLLLIPVLLAVSLGSASAAPSKAAYTYANGIQLAPGTSLPIFKISSISVTADVTKNIALSFSSIYNRSEPGPDSFKGYSRFTYLNQDNNAVLEQFGATGGFYAYNPSRAFGNENPSGGSTPTAVEAKRLACQFLVNHISQLPTANFLEVPGVPVSCDLSNPPYQVSTEWLTSQSAMPTSAPVSPKADIPLRVMVKVPILLKTETWTPNSPATIPFGGPGGHISMIFYNPPMPMAPNVPAPTLDPKIQGLQAVAMPTYGRSFSFNKLVPAVDPAAAQAQVLAQVQSAFPNGKNINIPVPALEYYLSDASTPQMGLEPDLIFSGITVDVDGTTLVLKDIVLPGIISGAGGAGPTVEIVSPTNGSPYLPGGQVTLQGKISDGTAPYNYDWQLEDGTSLNSGTANASGLLPLFVATLPVPESKSELNSLAVRLIVTDADGITRQEEVSLTVPKRLYLPSIMNVGVPTSSQMVAAGRQAAAPQAPNYTYSFGVEYGSDYPPYGPGGPDLGGVPPDANGFSAGLGGLGWPRIFNWYNSLAWERDWRDCSLGGSDCTYGVDRTDFVYYSGHGNNGGIAVPSNGHDSGWFDGINARYQNARWVGFSSCLTLRAQWTPASDAPIRRWFNAFQGAHMLLGFNSVMADIAFGGPLVDNMRMPTFLGIPFPWAQRTIAEAWVQTAFQMNAGKPAYIYAWKTGVDPSTNKLPQAGDAPLPRPYPVQWFYWVWWDE